MRNQLITLTLALALVSPSYAHQGAMGAVKERMDAMSAMGKANKAIARTLKSKGDLDYSALMAHADTISKQGKDVEALFHKHEISDVSEASPKIWQNWDDFVALSNATWYEADQFKQLAGAQASQQDLKAQFKNIAKSCKACHKKYRIKKQ